MTKKILYPHVPKSKMVEAPYREYPHMGGKPKSSPESVLPRDRDVKQAVELAEQAISILKTAWHMNDFDSALWRFVDATGLVARYASKTATGTPSNPTGLGYAITQE